MSLPPDGDPLPSWRPVVQSDVVKRIVQLPEDVVNRIAAGEVVQRPANAVKELLENSLDAGATRISIVAQNGGLASLRIEDNGHGINPEDLPLLCQRFATSKLQQFDDLKSIGTYGFRGEALASLSMVCRVEVTTRRAGSNDTHIAHFREGVLKSSSVLPAGLSAPGTVIKATEMFYSMPQRKAMFQKPAEEYRQVVDVMTKYAVQYPHASFTCRKSVASPPDLSVSPSPDRRATVKQLYGAPLADSLLDATVQSSELNFNACLLFSSLSHFSAKTEVVIFINGRLVLHDALTRMVKQLYAPLLPKKAYPWVFLQLNIDPGSVDVNAHPTKEKVIFLHESEIAERVEAVMAPLLQRSLEQSGALHLKRKLGEAEGGFGVGAADSKKRKPAGEEGERRDEPYAHELVRTDPTVETGALLKYFGPGAGFGSEGGVPGGENLNGVGAGDTDAERLDCVRVLLKRVGKGASTELKAALSASVYVGWVNDRHILLQLGLDLYLVDCCVVTRALFYQLSLTRLAEFKRWVFQPIPVAGLFERCGAVGGAPAVGVLAENREMLSEYFAIDFKTGGPGGAGELCLTALPQVLVGFPPSLRKLAVFVARLAVCVDYTEEMRCVHDVCSELADFYMLDDGVVVPRDVPLVGAKETRQGGEGPPSGGAGNGPGKRETAEAALQRVDTLLVGGDAGGCCGSHTQDGAAGGAAPPLPPSTRPACSVAVPDLVPSDDDEDDGADDPVPLAIRDGTLQSIPTQQPPDIRSSPAAPLVDPTSASDEPDADVVRTSAVACDTSSKTKAWVSRHVLYPAIKTSLLPLKAWTEGRVFKKVADLPTMYKIFERC
ncbi:DNA mismatch repair protein MLH1 [Diplonema papillatum]|nr:DNA mismatch repair protein MLH1 [Diplonema papillatum]